jgi:adenylate kinase family enzyme
MITLMSERIAIVGNGGGGKSTLAVRLSANHQVPYYSVDQVQWHPKWTAAPSDEVAAVLDGWANQPGWVIDGWGPWPSIDLRLRRATRIVFVDFPLWAHFWLAAERQISLVRGLPRPDPIAGCDDSQITRRLFEMIWRVDQEAKPELVRLIDQHKHGKAYQHVTSPDLLSSIQ